MSAHSKKTKNKRSKDDCRQCDGRCCRYFALQIDTPTDWQDYDNIRWYLCHQKTSVFVEEGKWYLQVDTPCQYLCPKTNRCLQYSIRPVICRNYSISNCDKNGDGYHYELHFKSAKQMERYMRIKFGSDIFEHYKNNKNINKKRSKKSRNKK